MRENLLSASQTSWFRISIGRGGSGIFLKNKYLKENKTQDVVSEVYLN